MINFNEIFIKYCIKKKLSISIAESCTGGMIVSKLIAISGASEVIDCGLVTYSNSSKSLYLGVSNNILVKYGAVSRQVAKLMVEGLKKKHNSDIHIGVTGIAGPKGGTKIKPVGTVFHSFNFKKNNKNFIFKQNYSGTRFQIRLSATKYAIRKAYEITSSII